jgi:uncharacterized protein (UPF0264 family)
MTKLIVSVRSAAEAETACTSGADLIDIKEPRNGSLGAAAVETVREIVRQVAGRKQVSVALGDLPTAREIAELAVIPGLQYAKLGLAGSAASQRWQRDWRDALDNIPAEVNHVAVIYADFRRARSPRPAEILEAAAQFGCAAVLIDTWDKTAGNLLDHWTLADVERFVRQVQSAGMMAVVAGSLDEISIASIASLRPDFVAVRSSVCRGGRSGQVDGKKVQRLTHVVQSANTQFV